MYFISETMNTKDNDKSIRLKTDRSHVFGSRLTSANEQSKKKSTYNKSDLSRRIWDMFKQPMQAAIKIQTKSGLSSGLLSGQGTVGLTTKETSMDLTQSFAQLSQEIRPRKLKVKINPQILEKCQYYMQH